VKKADMTDRPDKPIDLRELAPLAPELALALASVSSDIAMVIDPAGVIQSVSLGNPKLSEATSGWVGRHWSDTVTQGSRAKVDQLIDEACVAGLARRREVSLLANSGSDIPMAYSAIRLGESGPLIAAGRDMRAIAAIQQHFIQTQQEMEQTYWSRRQSEARYRLLFQVATDAVLVVDALTLQVVEANPAAADLLGVAQDSLAGSEASLAMDAAFQPAFLELLTTARTTGQPAEIRSRMAGGITTVAVAATPFRADNSLLLMVRVRPLDGVQGGSPRVQPAEFVEKMPDAVVVTDSSGGILMANPAFARLCERGGETQLKGRRVDAVLAELAPYMSRLVGEARRRGLAGPLKVVLNTGALPAITVEVVATMLDEGDQECIGLKLRILRAEEVPHSSATEELNRALSLLMVQLGEANLDVLVDRAGLLVQKHLLKSACERAQGDAATAAATLGLSVAELQRRLRESDLPDLDGPSESAPSGFLN
jgi:transcriptional regulator PpsR